MIPKPDPRLLSLFRSFSQVAAITVILMGCLVLLGWMLDITVLKSIRPDLAATNPTTALLFILSGVSLWTMGKGQTGQSSRSIGKALASLVALVALLRLGEYWMGLDLGIDRLLFENPSRISPLTALNFLLIGLAVVFMDVETRQGRRPAQLLTFLVALSSLVILLSYLYSPIWHGRVVSYTHMALPTSLAFIVLCVGLFLACPNCYLMAIVTDQTAGGMVARRLLPAAIVVPPTLGAEKDYERIRAEQQLRLQAAALEATANAIVITDCQGNITWVNPAFTRATGYTAEEVIGKTPRLIKSGQHDQSFYEDLWEAILAGRIWRGEVTNRHKDGSLYTDEQTITPVLDEKGQISHFVAVKLDVTERKRAEERIKYLAHYDSLTNLPNRTLLLDRLQNAILTAQRENRSVAFLLMDMDRFKEINDTLGHHWGDLLLQQIGQRLKNALHEKDIVARLGGDEFAVVLPLAESKHALMVADKTMKALEPSFVIEGLPIVVEASIGIAVYPDHGANAETLMQRADIAMYAAKQTGRGHLIYAPDLDQHSPRQLALMGELRRAIEQNELFLHYQPEMDLKTGRVIGVEALVRWQHPEYGPIPPDQFIVPAERTGLIKPLTLWVLKEVHRQCEIWHQAGIEISISANLSVRNLQDPELPDRLAELIQVCGVAPGWLGLEVTESAIMSDPVHVMDIVTRVKAMGIRLVIDDFGIGYSSLAYLAKLPVETIKIDRSFVMGMMTNESDAVIVRSTIDLAHSLGLKAVAEGVETKEALDQLKALGCDTAQGHYICRPLPAGELTRWLKESPSLNISS